MTLSIENLPYSKDALSPHISKETLNFHYEKHHKNYLLTLQKFIKQNIIFNNLFLEKIIIKT